MATKIKEEFTTPEEQLVRWKATSAEGGRKSRRQLDSRISVAITECEPDLDVREHKAACVALKSAYFRAVALKRSDIDLAELWAESSAVQN